MLIRWAAEGQVTPEEIEAQLRKQQMVRVLQAELPHRFERAARVKLQQVIPHHWFSAAASECARMFIAGFFYGCITVAQAYIEALSKYLAEFHGLRVGKDTEERCRRLHKAGVISADALAAALSVFSDRNDYHHLNKDVEQEYQKLSERAEECVNHLHTLESEVFAYTMGEGKVIVKEPKYWPPGGDGLIQGYLRQLW